MNIDIIYKPFSLNIHGFSGQAVNKDYAGTAFKLMDRMWKVVKGNNLANKGLNVWVYEPNEMVFAGVKLKGEPKPEMGLERKHLVLEKYAYCKHIGPYHLIKQTGLAMRSELQARNIQIISPYIEIYGHWTQDETKLETELIMAIGR